MTAAELIQLTRLADFHRFSREIEKIEATDQIFFEKLVTLFTRARQIPLVKSAPTDNTL